MTGPRLQPTDPMSTLRALLLTDVVDSTKLTEALGDAAMADLWIAHDRASRDLLPAWRGREIDKTDGMLLLFDNAADAVGYALAYHRALADLKLPFSARAGIHVGPVSLRANSADDIARGAKPVEVDGLALPIAARVMSIALGRQTLLSTDARLALGVASERVQSHGHWRLQGVAEPMELFEIGAADAPFAAPPDAGKAYRVVRQGELWQPVRQIKHSLPAERDSFVGRQEPLLALAKKLEDGARLVSVLGMGGTGKTRLVTRFAWSWLGEFPGGVWFCDLSQARSVDGIFFAVAQGLDVPLGKTDPAVQLAHAINGRGRCLVILDNFEQVARHAEETLGRWLDRAAQAKFIVTTREVLGIVGEETMALAPLPASDAAALFLRRAEAARQGYRPGSDDLTAIEQLVKVLDGLPLAIELAAARVRVMPPRTLLARMNERFSVLWSKGGRHDRQATLRAAFDWSWELLSEPEKIALAQLSVFEGGFTLEAAESVLDLPHAIDAPCSVDVVNWLVDKSFVRQVSDERFDLLESVREYAAEHLRTAGRFAGSGVAAQGGAEHRHGLFYASQGPKRATANACKDLENLVAACRRATACGDGDVAARALDGAWGALTLRGPFKLGVELAARVRAISGLPAVALSLVNRVEGRALMATGRMAEARLVFDAAIGAAQEGDDRECRVRALGDLAELHIHEGHMEDARQRYTEALEASKVLPDRTRECALLSGLGSCHEYLGEFDIAAVHYEQALKIARASGERRWEGGALGNLGQLLANQGRGAAARELYEAALAIARELGDRRWEGDTSCNLGLLNHAEGRHEIASAQLQTALRAARELGYVRLESIVLCNVGIVEDALGDHDAARSSFDAAIGLARSLRDRRSEGQFLGYLGALHARQGRLDAGLECVQSGAVLLRSVADLVSLSVLLCQLVEVELLAGCRAAAESALAEAEGLATALKAQATSEIGLALERARSSLGVPQLARTPDPSVA